MKSKHTALIRLAFVVFVAAVAFSSVHLFRGPSQDHSRTALEGASKYVAELPMTTTVLMYNNNQPTTAFIGNSQVAEAAKQYIEEKRPGRYRRAWGRAEIEVIVLSGITSLSDDARAKEISALGLRNEVSAEVQQASATKQFCLARRQSVHGWSAGGFVLVNTGNASEAEINQCILKGFDYLDGLPTARNEFEPATLPPDEVRHAIVDYVRSCAFESRADPEKQQRSNYGIFSQPDMTCVRDKLQQAVAKAG